MSAFIPDTNDNSETPSLRYPVICIDGPSGAGKGTITWRLAQTLGYQLLDSGALYRIVGLKAFEAGLITADASQAIDETALLELTQSLQIVFEPNSDSGRVDLIVNGAKIGEQVRNETVGGYASQVAVYPKVRQALLKLQQDMAIQSGLVADGRDMGTVVFPDAEAKIFLDASAEERAHRRLKQLQEKGFDVLIEAAKFFDKKNVGIYIIGGDFPLEYWYEIIETNDIKNIHFIPFQCTKNLKSKCCSLR